MSLPKSQRLKSRKAIDNLFKKRKNRRSKHLMIFYNFIDQSEVNSSCLVTVSVPKRLIKTAVNRNLLKRRILESYRANNNLIGQKIAKGKQLHIMFVYLNKEIKDYKTISENVKELLNKL